MTVWILWIKSDEDMSFEVFASRKDAEISLDNFIMLAWDVEDNGDMPSDFEERVYRFFRESDNEYDYQLELAYVHPASKD